MSTPCEYLCVILCKSEFVELVGCNFAVQLRGANMTGPVPLGPRRSKAVRVPGSAQRFA